MSDAFDVGVSLVACRAEVRWWITRLGLAGVCFGRIARMRPGSSSNQVTNRETGYDSTAMRRLDDLPVLPLLP